MKVNSSFCRVYMFTSAHRLHSATISDERNVEVYDKCNNYNGHGHDYKLEVALAGSPHPVTGMIFPLPDFDRIVHSVIDQLDYHHLNLEVPYFADQLSTGEIIIQYLWQQLVGLFPDGMLYHLKLWETNNNYFELGAG
jgi:6-pyruvoyltetrahydropterin/6-carboxytetrahydropterin synthase